MPINPPLHAKIRILEVSVLILAVFDVLIWQDTLVMATPMPENLLVPNYQIASEPIDKTTGVPVLLTIPAIDVVAHIESVGLKSDGSMDVPSEPLETAWYQYGPRPGDIGSSAIAGHVNWWRGATAVFADLSKLKPGDKITVQNDRGEDKKFVVKKLKMYGARAKATDVFSSKDGKSHLNLITCNGIWNKATKQYSKRLVVFTDLVTE